MALAGSFLQATGHSIPASSTQPRRDQKNSSQWEKQKLAGG